MGYGPSQAEWEPSPVSTPAPKSDLRTQARTSENLGGSNRAGRCIGQERFSQRRGLNTFSNSARSGTGRLGLQDIPILVVSPVIQPE